MNKGLRSFNEFMDGAYAWDIWNKNGSDEWAYDLNAGPSNDV